MTVTTNEVRARVMQALKDLEAQGKQNAEIGEMLGLSIPTVIRLKKGERINNTDAAIVTLVQQTLSRAA